MNRRTQDYNYHHRGYADTVEFDCAAIFAVLILLPASIFLMQSKRSFVKRCTAFAMLLASIVYLMGFEGLRTEETTRNGLTAAFYPEEFVVQKFGGVASREKRNGKGKTGSFYAAYESTQQMPRMQYFSLEDEPGEEEERLREDAIRRSTRSIDHNPVIISLVNVFSR